MTGGPRPGRGARRPGRTRFPRAEALEGRALLTFLPAVGYSVGPSPSAVVATDLNGDGRSDVVVANAGTSSLSVLFGNPNGTLTLKTDALTGTPATSLLAADLNGDGKPDIVATGGGPDARVFLNPGDGTFPFQPETVTNPFHAPLTAATAADFNGDGKVDLAAAETGFANNQQTAVDNGSVLDLFGDGTGAFPGPTVNGLPAFGAQVGHNPLAIVSGDFNHDGKPDVAVANQGDNTLGVLLNSPTTQTGNFSFFQLKGNFGTGNGPDSIATGDFNGDGNTDFVVGAQDGRLAVILGRGDGSIQSDHLIRVSGEVAGVAVADFNHDGKPDIAEVNGDGTNTVDVLLGNGDGTFQAPLVFRANSAGSDGLSVGDFNGDGLPDLVVSNSSGGDVTVLLNDGTWPAPPPPSGGGGGGAAAAVAAPVVPAAAPIGILAPTADGPDAAAPWAPATARHRAPGFGRLG